MPEAICKECGRRCQSAGEYFRGLWLVSKHGWVCHDCLKSVIPGWDH